MTEQDDEINIRALMREILRAFREHDIATLDRVLAEEFTFSDPSGRVWSKQQWLADIASGEMVRIDRYRQRRFQTPRRQSFGVGQHANQSASYEGQLQW